MERVLDGLNAAQREAVTHDTGPLLIVAGAGTGKTTAITRRIAWLISTKKARPEEILALTFTDKAAAEMEVRVDTLVPYGYADVTIATFHAFGDRVLRENALEVGLTTDFRVLSRAEQVIFFRDRLFEFPLEHYPSRRRRGSRTPRTSSRSRSPMPATRSCEIGPPSRWSSRRRTRGTRR